MFFIFENKYLWGVNSNIYSGSVDLVSLDFLNVDHKFLSVTLYNFAYLLSFVMASDNLQWEQKNVKNTPR